MEISVTPLGIPLIRHKSEPLPQIVFSNADDDNLENETNRTHETEVVRTPLPDVGGSPEVVYGLMPRMAWMYRLMERAGVSSRSARSMSWYDSEKDSYQHHAEYLKRLSKLREELIHQEQANLANALERLRMRSYGREFVYSRPQKDKKQQRLSAQPDVQTNRKTLLTTFEKFQRMRPKKDPPCIMPLEGKSLIEAPITEQHERHERHFRQTNNNDRGNERSVDENVRLNLQRISTHPIPSIPRQQRKGQHRDIVLESSTYRRNKTDDSNNSSSAEERIAQMQKQKQKLMKLRHEAREAEKQKLAPQSFRLDSLSDEDRMNLDKLKDYYCIYYVPNPASSPNGTEGDESVQFPTLNHTCGHSHGALVPSSGSKSQRGFKVASDLPVPPQACNCSCRMYVSGNKVETPFDKMDYSINQTQSANYPEFASANRRNGYTSARQSSRNTDRSDRTHTDHLQINDKFSSISNSQEKMQIRINMPSIVYNNPTTPEPTMLEPNTGLVKAFKQKELRQKELSNLIEDVKEINKRTEALTD